MELQPVASPLSQSQLIDEYFIENRTKLLDLAAFLDRLDRVVENDAQNDFRMRAFLEGLRILCADTPERLKRIQMILSDPTIEPMDVLDQKSARGAYNHWKQEAH